LLASYIAKGGAGMVSMAGQFLNLVLQDLKLNQNLKVNRVTQSLVVAANTYGPFALEADYLRTYDLFYPMPAAGGQASVSGITIFLSSITMEQFDAEFKSPSTSNYPYEFATDLSTQGQTAAAILAGGASAGLLYIYPQTSGQLTLTHRYMIDQPDITTPETSTATPWFPYTQYLIHATAAYLMGVTGDDRETTYHAEAQAMLQPFLIMEGDEQRTVRRINLDPQHFHFARGLKPVKSYPY
jgi:hypothetical protein